MESVFMHFIMEKCIHMDFHKSSPISDCSFASIYAESAGGFAYRKEDWGYVGE